MVQARGRNSKKQSAVVKASRLPTQMEILNAVESLYADKIRPSSRILRKRLSEVLATERPWDVDPQKVLDICSGISDVEVVNDCQDEPWVRLVGREIYFVDIPSLEDPYPQELWCSFQQYFEDQKDLSLPGGRYECARALTAYNLPFLAGYSLGHVCHMVQLAISTKKILGYNLGSIVPYGSSQSKEKEQCAASNTACSGKDGCPGGAPPLALEDVKFHLRELLRSSPSTGIPLPNVKRLFKSRFDVQLSETALGYAKVSELLQDPEFKDICVVKQQGQGYIVTQAPAQLIKLSSLLSSTQPIVGHESPKRVPLFHVEPLSLDEAEMENEPIILVPTPSKSPGLPTWALSPATLAKDGYARIAHNTFIHMKLPSTPIRSERRLRTEPCSMGVKGGVLVQENRHSDDSTSEGSTGSDSSAPSSREQSPSQTSMHNLTQDLLAPSRSRDTQDIGLGQERVQLCANEPLCFEDDSTLSGPLTPSLEQTPNSVTPGILRKYGEARNSKARRTVRFSIQEGTPEAKEDLYKFQSVWTPGTCSKYGLRERNTFLDVAMPPLTPQGLGAVHQAKSCSDIL